MEIRTRIRSFFSDNRIVFMSFFLPVLLVLLAFIVEEIYPFGEHQIAVIDMYHQYVPFLSELQYKLQEGGSLFYTWNGAGGSNFWNLIAYYGASPLNLLLILIPKKFIVEGITMILLIKIGLAGSFMAVYLRSINRSKTAAVLGFSTLYALCSYVMAYYWCIMWIDAVALLPLCILGLNRLIDEKKAVMYTVTIALMVFSNYYMAIMVCIFILFYYPVLYFIKVEKSGVVHCLKVTGRAVGYSLLGVVMAAVMLLPTYISMQSTYYISADMPDNWVFYNYAIDVLNQLMPNSDLTYREGLPNLYCGMLVVMLLIFYWESRTINFREKALNTVFLIFLFLSLNINKLDFLWHGFHFPNQLPYRYTFVICFILIGMAYRAFLRIDQIKLKTVWAVFAGGAGYLVLAQKILKGNIDDVDLFLYGGLAWLGLYSITIVLYKKNFLRKEMFTLLIVILISCEMASNVCTSMDKVGNTLRTSYFENSEDIQVLVNKYDDEFARMEINDNYILNCPAFYHYKGLSQFSSSVNADTTAIMEKIGLEGEPGKNRFNYNQTNPVTNAILNVKYLIGKNIPVKDEDFKLVERRGNTYLYENRYPLSIGYMLDDGIRTWDYEKENPFDVLDDYVRAATSNQYESVFRQEANPEILSNNVSVEEQGDDVWRCELRNKDKSSKVVMKYTSDALQKYYLFIEADNAESIVVNTGKTEEEIDIRNDCGSIVNIGEVAEGKDFTVTIEYKKGNIGSITSHVRSMDNKTWQKIYAIISESMMEVTDFGDSYIKGKVHVKDDGILVTSVPYDKGWTLKVDGEKRKINELTGGVFISTPLESGEHDIELTFRPPGIIAGLAITLISIVLLTVLQRRRYRQLDMRDDSTEDMLSRGI